MRFSPPVRGFFKKWGWRLGCFLSFLALCHRNFENSRLAKAFFDDFLLKIIVFDDSVWN